MAKDLAVVLNNGSLNSVVTTALAAQKYRPVLLHADTTGIAGSHARAAYEQQVGHFKPYREHVLSMPYLSLIQPQIHAAAQAADPRQTGLLANQLLDLLPILAAGARFAAHYQASVLYMGLRVGPVADDLAQATEYIQILNELVQLPCGQPDLEIITPLLELEAWQVVDVGYQVNAPLERTWSCVEDAAEPCGACRGCRARDAAFGQAGKPDPLRAMARE
jgi:7-cyano-7-deazaguanine synthase